MKIKIIYIIFILYTLSSCYNKIIDEDNVIREEWFPKIYPIANPKNDDEYFFNYRLEKFAPSTEPLIKETFGETLTFEEIGFWEHNSYTSHAVGFTTNLPALTIIQYGETSLYGEYTALSESYFYNHLHYIKNLESGKTYHYRLAAIDYDRGIILSSDHTFTTKTITDDIILIPDEINTPPPYTLTESNAKYVLTQDLTVNNLAINIKASNIELDLDGHTIIYDNGAPVVLGSAWNDYSYNEEATFGIRAGLWNYSNFKILNGIIKQGKNGGAGIIGTGFNPLYLNHMLNTYNEIAGITVDYYGNSIGGMVTGNGHIHHNVLYDRGSVIDDRHLAIRAMYVGENENNIVSFNSLRRFRHRGIDSSGENSYNELYSDSFDTNSFCLGLSDNAHASYNKIFGMGYLPIGIGWGNHINVFRNFIYIRGFAPTMRSTEYNRKSAIAGMRFTNYDGTPFEDMIFEDNTIVLKAEDGCTQARGIWTSNHINDKNIIYRRNTVKVEAMPGNLSNPEDYETGGFYNDDVNNCISAVTFSGGEWTNSDENILPTPIIFEDNHLIGNVNLLTIGEGYGVCSSVWMYRTKMEKIDHDSEYFSPVRLGFWFWDTWNNRLVDTEWLNINTSEMTPEFYGGTGRMEIRYGESKTLTVRGSNGSPLSNRLITLTTTDDNYTQSLQTDGNGRLFFDLLTIRHFKYGNSQEHDGITGVPSQIDYRQYVISASGYQPKTVSISQLKNSETITFE